jgi:hypothetical protein
MNKKLRVTGYELQVNNFKLETLNLKPWIQGKGQ